ncbi:hypothetical protein MAC3UK_0004 [Bdellovibrio phage MAC3UK]|nr:hypothetical protein MAC3UK_0004 [Bdellovibrio phage MAC3UK]
MSSPEKLQIKYVLFGSKAKGGYFRAFESVSHEGIVGTIDCPHRGAPEVKTFFFQEKEYTKVSDVIEAWHRARLAADIQKGAEAYLAEKNAALTDEEPLNKFVDDEATVKKRLLHGFKENLLAMKRTEPGYGPLETQVFNLAIELGEATYGPTHYEFCRNEWCRCQQ